MHYYLLHRTLWIVFYLFNLSWLGILIRAFLMNRYLKHRVKGLLEVFDPGTALVSDDFVLGEFHGRPAWISFGSSELLSRTIQIGIKGRLSFPFNVQAFDSLRSARVQYILMYSGMVGAVFVSSTSGGKEINFWNLIGTGMMAFTLAFVHVELRRRVRSTAARIDIQLAATRLTPIETSGPDRAQAELVLAKPEFREGLKRIFDSCHADGVKNEFGGRVRMVSLEAFWRLPRGVLDISLLSKDNVRGMLTALANLSASAESTFLQTTSI
jgi:hypothetical protein